MGQSKGDPAAESSAEGADGGLQGPVRRAPDPTRGMVPRRQLASNEQSRPSHPTWPAALLMGGVVLVIVLIAALDALR